MRAPSPPAPGLERTDRILSAAELEGFERANVLRALEASEWRIAGARGAARLLGLKPSTLSSRMRALGIRRPSGNRGPSRREIS